VPAIPIPPLRLPRLPPLGGIGLMPERMEREIDDHRAGFKKDVAPEHPARCRTHPPPDTRQGLLLTAAMDHRRLDDVAVAVPRKVDVMLPRWLS